MSPVIFDLRMPAAADSRALRWTLSVLGDFLGVEWRIREHSGTELTIERDGAQLLLPGNLQGLAQVMPPTSLALLPWPTRLPRPHGGNADVPVLFGDPQCNFPEASRCELAVDVIRTAFFMLSRAEELAPTPRDRHGRFPGWASAAARLGVLQRPVVDEQVALLKALMNALWPNSLPAASCGRVDVSCDVDEPYERWIRSPAYLAQGLAGALLRRRSPAVAMRRIRNALASRRTDYRHDPNWTFDWYMDQCERAELQARFFFIARQGGRDVDAAYDLCEPRMLGLLRRIGERGHLIGLHGSYGSFRSAEALSQERQTLERACEMAGVPRDVADNRQHFLQWTVDDSVPCLELAGFKTDSSGGFSDAPGFRFGTSRAFQMWNWHAMRPSTLVQRPLIVMETTLLALAEPSISEQIVDQILALRASATRHGGSFGFLWHNSNLSSAAERQAFVRCIS